MKRFLSLVAVVALAALPSAFLSTSVSAAASVSAPTVDSSVVFALDEFEYESLAVDYRLARDARGHATLSVVETWVVLFPEEDQNRGIIRAIPDNYDGVPLHTSVSSVVDERGIAVPYEEDLVDGFVELALGTDEFVHGRITYVITYSQENVVRAFADTNSDEFYWDVNGTGHPVPFGKVSATVHIDEGLTKALTGNNACYQGEYGNEDTCDILQETRDDGETFTASVRNLAAGETLTIVVGFTSGTFVQVPPDPDYGGTGAPIAKPFGPAPWWADAAGIAVVLFAILGTTFTIIRRTVSPSESKGRGVIIPQYTVPKGINLLESADIAGRSWAGVSAQIVSFAVRGKLRILDYPVTASGAKYTLQLLDTTGLDDQELQLMSALFGGGVGPQSQTLTIGAVREVGVIDDGAARAVAHVQQGVRARVLARGFKRKRSSAAGFLLALCMFLLFFAAIALSIFSAMVASVSGWVILAPFVCIFGAIVTAGFAWRPAALTVSGAEWRDYLLGMRDYLQLAEADRFRMLQSPEGAQRMRVEGLDIRRPAEKVKLYEKLLPFAVMWGIEKEWAKELRVYYEEAAPDWFVSTGTFNMVTFSNALTTISRSAVVSSTPSSSSGGSSWSGSSGGSFSGGSGGGGFSGGGGGGGGSGGR